MTAHDFWSDRKILLTGGGGFLGRVIHASVARHSPAELLAPRAAELDLRDAGATRAYLAEHRPNLIIHAAALVGGIGANRKHPGLFFYENAVMGIHLIEEARRAGVEKFVCLGTLCAYPKFTPVPFREEDLWNGYPEETNAPYGIAKRALLVQLQAYRQEYGFNGIFILPTNLYGPGDNFDLQTSHVLPALIRKFHEAKAVGASTVTIWGSGTPRREFLHVDDLADALCFLMTDYESPEIINVGCGEDVTIAELAGIVRDVVGFDGEIVLDRSKPDGTPRKLLDVSKMTGLGWKPRIALRDGIRSTYRWFLEHAGTARA
jgi:GDP-L-fucose synthase